MYYFNIKKRKSQHKREKKETSFSKNLDFSAWIEYNKRMKRTYGVAVVGAGAAGLVFAAKVAEKINTDVLLLERGDRVGKKLSATGNGQGNISNERVGQGGYFSVSCGGEKRAAEIVKKYPKTDFLSFLENLGALCVTDERGRVYPASRQASALTDLLRYRLSEANNVFVETKTTVQKITYHDGKFELNCASENGEVNYFAKRLLLCTGGKAAKNFGTDGSAYALARAFGHTLTDLYPSLVQLKTEREKIKTLRGVRVSDARVAAYANGEKIAETVGDLLFTDYGVSGDAIFRLSAFIAEKIERGNVTLSVDFLPDVSEQRIVQTLTQKRVPSGELLCGIVNNQIGRAVLSGLKEKTPQAVASAVKAFALRVTGSLGFDYAQVTKGGVPISETDENLQSKKQKDLYFAGEILDVDGECGGFNLQFAYSSASVVAAAILEKEGGRV